MKSQSEVEERLAAHEARLQYAEKLLFLAENVAGLGKDSERVKTLKEFVYEEKAAIVYLSWVLIGTESK